jgi:outer membrane protein TolC
MKLKILSLFLMISQFLPAQNDVYLDSLVAAARRNWPAFRKQLAITGQKELIDKIVNVNWYPGINASGQVTYQSEVVTFPEVPNMPDLFPALPQDNYSVELDVNQTLWDGGVSKVSKELKHYENDVDLQQLNVETYNLFGKVNKLYTSVLLLKENRKTIDLSIVQLDSTIRIMESTVKNGVSLPSELDNLRAEKLLMQKELLKLESNIDYTLQTLNIITGLHLTAADRYHLPQLDRLEPSVRPELVLLDAKMKAVQSQADIYKSKRFPKFAAFGRLGYGRPGFDFMNTDLHGYYMVGAKFSWNVWDWNLLNKKRADLGFRVQSMMDAKEVTKKQLEMEQLKYQKDLERYRRELEVDKQVVVLKQKVYKTAESQLANGVITTTEYLKIFNDYKRARIVQNIDRLKIMEAQLDYLYSKGIKY